MSSEKERGHASNAKDFFLGGPVGRDVRTLGSAYFQSILEESRARVAKKKAELDAKAASAARPHNAR